MPALPFVLRFTFFFYPSVSSKGFQTLGRCDCFHTVNGTALCYLPADYSVACVDEYAPTELLATGWLAIALFGIGVPLPYASLLYSCRIAIRTEQKTPLATSLAFLHASLHPWALWWPLVEAWRVTNLFTVPTIVKLLTEHPAVAAHDHSSLRHVIYAGAPMYRADQQHALRVPSPLLLRGAAWWWGVAMGSAPEAIDTVARERSCNYFVLLHPEVTPRLQPCTAAAEARARHPTS